MKAQEAVEGCLYHLKEKGNHPEENAECYGLNCSKEFMRFLVFDAYGKRAIRMVMLTEEIEAV